MEKKINKYSPEELEVLIQGFEIYGGLDSYEKQFKQATINVANMHIKCINDDAFFESGLVEIISFDQYADLMKQIASGYHNYHIDHFLLDQDPEFIFMFGGEYKDRFKNILDKEIEFCKKHYKLYNDKKIIDNVNMIKKFIFLHKLTEKQTNFIVRNFYKLKRKIYLFFLKFYINE